MDHLEPVVIYQTFDVAKAHLMRSRLEGAGIPAEIVDEYSAANLVAMEGVRLMVPGQRAEEARALLGSTDAGSESETAP